ncbi:MAG TPA: methionyl-tRNA formyltransferase [Candidatus Saccharimonadales bacterium]|nr:methionyl-tRNA formyltransferase [Candidatus Saccharimonadales bacterium]
MKKTLETLVFFGSGPVAEASLKFLTNYFRVEAVVTKPATEEQMAKTAGSAKIYTVSSRDELNKLIADKPFTSHQGVIVDFGIIVDQPVIDYFPLGIINSHFSLLPRWRGADPISFAILNADQKTGVSLMLIEKELDTGKVLVQKSIPIMPDATTPSLTAELIKLSNQLLADNLPKYWNGQIKPRAQPHPSRATYSRKLTKNDGIIDWNKSAEQIEREIRAYQDWPKSQANLAGKEVSVLSAHILNASGLAGKVEVKDKNLVIYCGKDALAIDELRPAGKNAMSGKAFIAGHRELL